MKINRKNAKKTCWPIWPGEACNINCGYCIIKYNDNTVKKHYKSKTFKEIKDILNYYKNIGLEGGVSYDGGEITIFPYFLDLLKYGKEIGIKQVITTHRITFANEKKVFDIKEYGINELNMSIHTYKRNTYDLLHGKVGLFNLAMKGLRNLIDNNIKVNVNFVIMKDNVEDIFGFYLFSIKKKISMITYSKHYF